MAESTWKAEVLLAGSWRGATSVLLFNRHRRVVVDTGLPHQAHRLVEALKGQGLRPEDIEVVINTHFHVDHVLNNSLFPSSAIYASQHSYDWCRSLYSDLLDQQNWERLALKYYPEVDDYPTARKNMTQLRNFALRWWDTRRLGDGSQFRWIETEPLPEGLEPILTSGHVPGHLSVLVRNRERATVVAGDALLSRDGEDRVLTMIPHNRQLFLEERKRILSIRGRILPGHDREFWTHEGRSDPRSAGRQG